MTPPLFTVRLPDGSRFGPAAMDLVEQWAREGRVPTGAVLEPEGGGRERPVSEEPRLAVHCQAPPTVAVTPLVPAGSEGITTIIPYRNAPALAGYYLAVFGLIPVLGLVFAVPAVVLGIIGVRRRRHNPTLKGAVHAWIGIILGGLMTLAWGGGLLAMLVYRAI